MSVHRLAGVGENMRADAIELVTSAGLPTDGLDEAWAVFAALDDLGTLLGVSALERYGPANEPAFLLRAVAVRADARGTGIGSELVETALQEADRDADSRATIALLTETAVGYFERFGFRQVTRGQLPPVLSASPELTGACPDSARAYLRSASTG